MPELAYVDGVIGRLRESKLSATGHGFQSGYGVFETMRGYRGRLFRLGAHLQRLMSGAAFLDIKIDPIELDLLVPRLLEDSHLAEARVRLGAAAEKGGIAGIVITVESYQPPSAEDYDRGLPAVIASIRRQSDSPIIRHKTLDRREYDLAKAEAEDRGAAEAIFLNEYGQVTESHRCNTFMVKNGALKTPRLGCGLLPGITRAAILELARRRRIPFEETNISAAELLESEEVFITSSLIEIMPLTTIDGAIVGRGKIGRLTSQLSTDYRRLVYSETGG